MECDYDYKISITYLTPLLYTGPTPDFNDVSIQKIVGNQINESLQNQIKDELSSEDTNKFEIKSHCITIAGDTIMLSLLLQRPCAF